MSDEHIHIPYLREIVVFLVVAGVMVPLFHRIKVSPVLGYLLIGGVIGPYGLALWVPDLSLLRHVVITDIDGVRALAELGIVFLLFTIGLELSLNRLWSMRRMVFGFGSAQIVLSGAVIGGIAFAWGNSGPTSVLLGASLALSSTAIVMQLLMQSRRVTTPVGRATFSVLLAQDLAVVPILFAVGVLGASGEGNVALNLAQAVGIAVVTIAVIYFAGRLIMRPLLHLAAQAHGREVFMAAVLLTVVVTATITGLAGLSMALGAFLAGLLLAETEYRHEVEIDIEPFKGLMMGLFFISVGMGIDWRVLLVDPVWILTSVVGLYVLKTAIATALAMVFGEPRHSAVEVGLLLGQGGEFAFIVVGLMTGLALIPGDIAQFMLIVVGLTMLVTPLVATAARRLGARVESRDMSKSHGPRESDLEDVEGRVLLAGYGRVGEMIADVLEAESVPYLALDSDPDRVKVARRKGRPVFFGDAGRLELLQKTRIERAQAVVVTMNAPSVAERIVREIREACPTVPLFARARDKNHARRLVAAGASLAVPETVEASLQLAGRVLNGVGVSDEAVGRRLDLQRSIEDAE